MATVDVETVEEMSVGIEMTSTSFSPIAEVEVATHVPSTVLTLTFVDVLVTGTDIVTSLLQTVVTIEVVSGAAVGTVIPDGVTPHLLVRTTVLANTNMVVATMAVTLSRTTSMTISKETSTVVSMDMRALLTTSSTSNTVQTAVAAVVALLMTFRTFRMSPTSTLPFTSILTTVLDTMSLTSGRTSSSTTLIMAMMNALVTLKVPTTLMGTLGTVEVHPALRQTRLQNRLWLRLSPTIPARIPTEDVLRKKT